MMKDLVEDEELELAADEGGTRRRVAGRKPPKRRPSQLVNLILTDS